MKIGICPKSNGGAERKGKCRWLRTQRKSKNKDQSKCEPSRLATGYWAPKSEPIGSHPQPSKFQELTTDRTETINTHTHTQLEHSQINSSITPIVISGSNHSFFQIGCVCKGDFCDMVQPNVQAPNVRNKDWPLRLLECGGAAGGAVSIFKCVQHHCLSVAQISPFFKLAACAKVIIMTWCSHMYKHHLTL